MAACEMFALHVALQVKRRRRKRESNGNGITRVKAISFELAASNLMPKLTAGRAAGGETR